MKPKPNLYKPNLFIINMEKDDSFARLSKECLHHKDLKSAPKIVLTYITSKPPNWNLNISDISSQIGETVHTVTKSIKTLTENNYLFNIQIRKGGRIQNWGYVATMIRKNIEEVEEYIKENCSEWKLLILKDKKTLTTSCITTCGNTTCGETETIKKERTKIKRTKIESETKVSEMRRKIQDKKKEQDEKKSLQSIQEQKNLVSKVENKESLKSLFELWYSKVIPEKRKKHYTELKAFKKTLVLINKASKGTLFSESSSDENINLLLNQKISIEGIIECAEMHILALSDDYEPVNKKYLKIHLNDFIYNPYSRGCKSYLAYWMYNEPKPIIKLKETKLSGIFDEILKEMNWTELKTKEMNNIINFLNTNESFIQSIKIALACGMQSRDKIIAKALIDCINKKFKYKNDFVLHPNIFANSNCLSWIKTFINESQYTR